MKILFLSNYFNHHQAALCDALYRQTGGDFRFVETAAMPPEQQALGFPALERDYVLRWQEEPGTVLELLRSADAVLAGEAPPELVRVRVKAGKLLLRYSERPLRQGPQWHKYLPRLLRWHWRNPPGKPIYLLSAGAYTAGDYARFGLFRGRAFRWGYFPEVQPLPRTERDPARVLWCGRLLGLKHPEAALEAAARLAREGLAFTLTFVGRGPEEESLKQRARRLGLEDRVFFPGAMSPEAVRQEMARSGIFLFTSDRQEGWGVVLNEAMNSGCAVIASSAAGSVPELLENGKNGLIYPSGDVAALTAQLRALLTEPRRQRQLGLAACETVRTLWSPETAARRLLTLTEVLLAGGTGRGLYREGPCALLEPERRRWRP